MQHISRFSNELCQRNFGIALSINLFHLMVSEQMYSQIYQDCFPVVFGKDEEPA